MTDATPSLPRRLERLVTGGTALTKLPRLDQVLQGVADLAREVANSRYAALGLLAPDRRSLSLFVTSGLSPGETARIGPPPRGHGILGLLIRDARTLRLPDLARHPDSVGFPPGHPPMHSFLGTPVIGTNEVLGNLYLTEKVGGGHFTEEDEYLIVLLASMAAAAMENARHHEESARHVADIERLMRSRERFFAMVNHELRNSLAAVLGWAEMLVRKKDPATIPRAAFEVLESAESAAGIIGDLLDLSRLDEDRLRPILVPVDPLSVINQAVGRVTPVAAGRGVEITRPVAPDIPVVSTDGHRVEQVLVNLLQNAVRHSNADSVVEVTVQKDAPSLVIGIRDHGPGIPAEELPHIFDMYYSKPGREGVGVGLGLPLSRRLAVLLGGELYAINHPEGGALFTLHLPLSGKS
jgi:signal transduction histidine kinase